MGEYGRQSDSYGREVREGRRNERTERIEELRENKSRVSRGRERKCREGGKIIRS